MKKLEINEIQELQLNLMKKLHKFFLEHNIKYYLIAGSALGSVRHSGFIPWDDDIDIALFRNDYEKFLLIIDGFDKKYEICNFKKSKNCDYCLTRIYFNKTFIKNDSIEKSRLDKRLYLDVFPLDNIPDNVKKQTQMAKKIKKIKKILYFVDYRKYDNKFIKNLIKKIVSYFLLPFRKKILEKMDREMRKYEKTDTKYVCSLCSQYSFNRQLMLKSVYGKPILHKFEDTEFFIPEKIDDYLTQLYGKDYMIIPSPEKRRKSNTVYLIEKEEKWPKY